MLAEKLNMTNEEAEKWIVDLIRNARLDAKIDSKLVRSLFENKCFQYIRFKREKKQMQCNSEISDPNLAKYSLLWNCYSFRYSTIHIYAYMA